MDVQGHRVADGDGPVTLWQPGQPLPVFATLDDVAVVIIPAAEYRELVALRLRVPLAEVRAKARARHEPRGGLSTIERDQEVAIFLRDGFRGGVTVEQHRAACLARFGPDRTPSVSRIQRFRLALRRSR